MTEERLQEIENDWLSIEEGGNFATRAVAELTAEVRRLQAAVNAAELRGQDTGFALARSNVLAWVKRNGITGSAIEELIAGLSP